VVGTGDELVDINDTPESWQLRLSNSMALAALLVPHAQLRLLRAGDDSEGLARVIGEGLEDSDMLLMTGGVSAGRFDAVPSALAASGVQRLFHKVAIRPGKPLWFGLAGGRRPVFGLPGNPVASLICARRFALPMVLALGGFRVSAQRRKVRVGADAFNSGSLTHFIPVRLSDARRGLPVAYPVSIRGSGDFSGLAASDGFIEATEGHGPLVTGATAAYHAWSTEKAAA
jgi:molybdopterin molybdotransferase